MASTKAERIEALEKKRAQINARIQKERAKLAQRNRKDDTRRMILLGRYISGCMRDNPEYGRQVHAGLDKYLTAERDRQLFNLK